MRRPDDSDAGGHGAAGHCSLEMGARKVSRIDTALNKMVTATGRKVEVEVKWEVDDSPDLDFYGKYTDQYEEGAIDRRKLGQRGNGEFRYFVSANNSVHNPKDWDHVSGKEKADLIRKHGSLANVTRSYAKSDYERMEAYNRGEWHMRGCVVTVRLGSLKAKGSLWGIESDCGDAYEKEVTEDVTSSALRELHDELKTLKKEI